MSEANERLQKCVPLSLIMALGVPNLERMFSFKNDIIVLWLFFQVGIAFTHLETYSTISTMYSLRSDSGNGPIKSIPQ